MEDLSQVRVSVLNETLCTNNSWTGPTLSCPTSYNGSNINVVNSSRTFESPFNKPHIKIIFIISYSIVFAMCFFGNAMVLFAIARSPRLRGMTNFFLANLAVADFCVGVFCVLPNLSIFLSPNWIFGDAMCKIYYYVYNVSYTASIIILTAIAMERYIAIIHPLKSRTLLTRRRLVWVQSAIWIIAFIYNIPYLIFYNTMSFMNSDTEYCYTYGDHFDSLKGLSLTNCIVWYLVPLMTIAWMYYKVAAALWKTTLVAAMRLKDYRHSGDDISRVHSVTQGSLMDRRKNVTFNLSGDSERNSMRSNEEVEYGRSSMASICNERDNCDPKSRQGVSVVFERHCTGGSVPTMSCCIRYIPEQRPQCSSCEKMVPDSNSSTSSGSTNSRLSFRYNQTEMRNSRRVVRARRKVIRLLVAVVISFALCVFPHQLKVMNHYWRVIPINHKLELLFSPISFIFLYLNSALNPVLYALFSNHFRRSFKESIPCLRTTIFHYKSKN